MNYVFCIPRRTPDWVAKQFAITADLLAERAFTVRLSFNSEHDATIEKAALKAGGCTDVFIPWNRFQGRRGESVKYFTKSAELAAAVTPGWSDMNESDRRFVNRYAQLVHGRDLVSPTDFVVTSTFAGDRAFDGKGSSNELGAVIALAVRAGIPVINLVDGDAPDSIRLVANAVQARSALLERASRRSAKEHA